MFTFHQRSSCSFLERNKKITKKNQSKNLALYHRVMRSIHYLVFLPKDTFSYHSNYWSNKNAFGEISGTAGFNHEETKMPSYWSNNFTQICLGMRVCNVTEWLVINKQASSLHSLVADNNYKPTSLGRDKWKSLIDESSLQLECNMEGFNTKSPTASDDSAFTRIGIISNNEEHCNSCDSRIGIGSGGTRGGMDGTNSCGNEAIAFKSDNGEKHIKANCYILIK